MTKDVSYPSGAAFVIRRDVYSAVGGFDETYFLYHEDVDLGLRIHAAGWKVVYVPAARAVHRHESGLKPDKIRLLERNRWTTLTKNLPAAYFIRCGLLLGVSELGLLLYTDYVYPFEIAAVILLVAIVAAIALTLRHRKDTKYINPAEQLKVRRKDRVRMVSMPSERAAAGEPE